MDEEYGRLHEHVIRYDDGTVIGMVAIREGIDPVDFHNLLAFFGQMQDFIDDGEDDPDPGNEQPECGVVRHLKVVAKQ